MSIITIDFETKKIDGALPPKPVSVAIKVDNQPSKFFAWDHPSENNCTLETATKILEYNFKNHKILCHNGLFDLAVAKYHLGIDFPKDFHDTLLLLFLRDPHAHTLSLKPSAEQLLNLPPDEQTELKEWLIRNVPGATNKNYGAYISEAPSSLVGKYAIGDVDRTYTLFMLLYDKYKGKAYDREKKLTPILIDNTLTGIKLDELALYKDFTKYSKVKKDVEARIYKKLGKMFNIDSSAELAAAVNASYDNLSWLKTKTGKDSTSKKSLMQAINDPELLALLNYRGTITTFVDTFLTSWIEKNNNGRLHFIWNQVRNNEQSGGFMGTRTGRMSSVPSMLNVPSREFIVPEGFGLPPLPIMKKYFLPEEDHIWIENDYNSQEIRLLAHFEDGILMRAFQKNPRLDMHQMMSEILTQVIKRELTRLKAKTTAFSILYGSGIGELAKGLGTSEEEARFIKRTYLNEVPGIRNVQNEIKYAWDAGEAIETWGGRKYFKESSKVIVDPNTGYPRMMDFTYKGLNYLIQGSSADVTKQAIINYNEIKSNDARFLLSVHDSINISGRSTNEIVLLTEAMMDIKVDVPMICDSKYGPSYGQLQKWLEVV